MHLSKKDHDLSIISKQKQAFQVGSLHTNFLNPWTIVLTDCVEEETIKVIRHGAVMQHL